MNLKRIEVESGFLGERSNPMKYQSLRCHVAAREKNKQSQHIDQSSGIVPTFHTTASFHRRDGIFFCRLASSVDCLKRKADDRGVRSAAIAMKVGLGSPAGKAALLLLFALSPGPVDVQAKKQENTRR